MHHHITAVAWLLVACLVMPAAAKEEHPAPGSTHDHDHAHDHDRAHPPTSQPAEDLEALTREQVVQPVLDARQARDQAWIDATETFRAQVKDAMQKVEGEQHERMGELVAALNDQLAAIEEDRYISELVADGDQFAIEAIADQRKAYLERAIGADEAYVEALRAALARDVHGYIGDMMIENLDTSTDTNLMWLLMDWYWHHQMLDTPPRSFERIIRLGYRYVELEPQAATTYCNTAWMLWSRWVSWTKNPDEMPIGEGDHAKAHALLLKGREACMEDSAYHIDAGMTMWGLAQFHKPQYWDFIAESFRLADKHAETDEMHVKARMLLGHAYRKMDEPDKARESYARVLALDPDHEIAARIIGELDETE